ncbi:MAG: PhoU family transcriptional regulator [Epsilonproteobacteria bacterium]|nr:PhoU family transcriptional regulator [Campylobacterota bacterium]
MLPRYENKLNEIRTQLSTLVASIISANTQTLQAFEENEDHLYENARINLKSVQSDANMIDNEVIKTLALYGPEAQELRLLVAFLKMTNELDRVGENMKKYNNRIQELSRSQCDLAVMTSSIIQLQKTTLNALQYIHDYLESMNTSDAQELFRKVSVEESKNDDLFSIIEKDLLNLISQSHELSADYVKVLSTLRKLERTGDRTVNIASLLLYAQEGGELNFHA